MMGVGKSTVGRLLAQRLGRPYVDGDERIEQETGMTVGELFRTRSEQAFRDVEQRVLAEALAAEEPAVIGPGGGVITRADGREALRTGPFVVWLRARPETLVAHVGDGRGRPLLEGSDVRATVERLVRERAPLYQEVADLTIDVDGLEPHQVVDQLATKVRVA
jgi:shikimate kinase